MKFTMSGTQFKKLVDDVGTIRSSNMIMFGCDVMAIYAYHGMVSCELHDIDKAMHRMAVADSIEEEGNCYVDYTQIVKAYNMSGTVTVKTDGQYILISNGKQTNKIYMHSNDVEWPEIPEDGFDEAFDIESTGFIKSMAALDAARLTVDNRPPMTGFMINDDREMFACDGFKLFKADLTDIMNTYDFIGFEMIFPGDTYKILKSVTDLKAKERFTIGTVDDWVSIESPSMTYTCKLIREAFINVKSILDGLAYHLHSFGFNADDVCSIAKDYAKNVFYIQGKDKMPAPMYFLNGHDEMCTYAASNTYSTCNKLDGDNVFIPDGFWIALNPNYVVDALKAFKGMRAVMSVIDNKKIVKFSSHESNITAYVLPILGKSDEYNKAMEMLY